MLNPRREIPHAILFSLARFFAVVGGCQSGIDRRMNSWNNGTVRRGL